MEKADLAIEVVFVLENGIEVSVHANPIGEHLLLVVKERIGAEVLRIVNVLVNGGAAATNGGVR